MGRKLRDKLPKLTIPNDRASEMDWQILDARRKLKQKEYADKHRSATFSDIAEGDLVLLKQARENKLSPTYEPEPYRVRQRNGNAVVVENSEGVQKMRNTGHMNKFVEPEIEVLPEPAEGSNDTVQIDPDPPTSDDETNTGQGAAGRPVRAHEKPKYLNDYVSCNYCCVYLGIK